MLFFCFIILIYNLLLIGLHNGIGTSQKPIIEKKIRILCWIPMDLNIKNRTLFVQQTWTRQCDRILFMSSQADTDYPVIGLNVSAGVYHLVTKAKVAWTYIYHNYFDDADFFVRADPDTYMIIYNLRRYLASRDTNLPEYYGHRQYQKEFNFTYVHGGAGMVLTRESLRRLVTIAFEKHHNCMSEGKSEYI